MIRIDRSALKVLVLLVFCTLITKSDADDAAIRDLCLWKVGTFPHPDSSLCNKFVQCQIFNGKVMNCGNGEIFFQTEGCVPGHRETCQRSVMTNPTLPTLTASTPVPPPLNIDLNDFCRDQVVTGIFPNPNDCLSLVICREGFFLGTFPCPVDTPVVDPETGVCFEGNPETCEIGPPTPPTNLPPPPPTLPPGLPTLPPPSVLPPTDICRGNNRRFVADPDVCYRFFYCLLGFPIPGECDEDRIFDSFFRGCVRGNRETCTRDRIINVTVVTPTRSSED